MKIALTTSGETLTAPLESRFGRAPRFLLYDLATDTFELVDNSRNLNAAQGAGIQAAQNVVRAGAASLITGHCGPKAFRVLQESGIPVYLAETGTVAEVIEQYRSGSLDLQEQADVEGHW